MEDLLLPQLLHEALCEGSPQRWPRGAAAMGVVGRDAGGRGRGLAAAGGRRGAASAPVSGVRLPKAGNSERGCGGDPLTP